MSQERILIDNVKHHFATDLDGAAHAYMKLSNQVSEDLARQNPALRVDSATLAIFDIAYGEFKVGKDPQGAVIMCQDAQRRINTAGQSGFDVRNLQIEEDKLKAVLPPFEVSGSP